MLDFQSGRRWYSPFRSDMILRPHGGYLTSWDSNETMAALTLVCKSWQPAATTVMYRSVALTRPHSDEVFLRTLASTIPSRASKVKFLVLSIGEDAPFSPDALITSEQFYFASINLIKILSLCSSSVTHLQVHPLHSAAREPLFAAIKSLSQLRTLVCSPRFYQPDAAMMGEEGSWGSELYSRTDLYDLALPAMLDTLELDFGSSWSARHFPIHNGLDPTNLRRLRLRCDTDDDVLWQVLGQCTGLEVCELYFEKLLSRDETTAALRGSTDSMKHLSFLSKYAQFSPTMDDLASFDSAAQPLFDRLLPAYIKLETLAVSATEISTDVFRLLPASLKSLTIQAFNHVSTFIYTPQLVSDLAVAQYAKGLESLSVHDAAEAWDEVEIGNLRQACEKRGVLFYFRPDSEVGM
ncbi:hypothetical protein JCM11641_007797 [Rhodosporidiobolus odoratus]